MNRICGTVFLVFGLLFVVACGVQKNSLSDTQVPDAVKLTFHEMFPAVQNPEWSLKADHNYEAEFTAQQVEMAVKFDPSGKWLETESAIQPSEVPQAVQTSAAAQFKDYRIVETQSLQRASEQRLIYELHLDNGKQIVKAQFSPEGSILLQSTKPKQ